MGMIIESFILVFFACAAVLFLSHSVFFSWYESKRNAEMMAFLRSKKIIT
jgi:hypothetical protein